MAIIKPANRVKIHGGGPPAIPAPTSHSEGEEMESALTRKHPPTPNDMKRPLPSTLPLHLLCQPCVQDLASQATQKLGFSEFKCHWGE